MSSKSIHYQDREDALSSTRGELLEILLQPDEDFYPWNPAEPEAEAYFAELERGFLRDDWQEEEGLKRASQSLFQQLDQCWSSPRLSVRDLLKESLSQRFTRVPQLWLDAIANQALQVARSNLSLAEQLVMCVKPLLPNWGQEDLLVFARPWAYAMRGTLEPNIEGISGKTGAVEWTELSQMEQVRFSLQVAHAALAQLQDNQGDVELS